ncbi:MAG: microcin transporter [Devosia sp.]|uniref:peptide antibiotic transporter SbmA n=1 Tax=Devosia sp. TaxID=1871048 RepID=UPI00261DD3F2|nr:peptide antibiotic transporter SbmA [Devosia sp.]MDB5539356.1 microcin transporter [Devosia sp.]
MFRSFFPEPKLFFSSAVLLMLAATLLFFVAGQPIRSVLSVDRFLAPAICAPAAAAPTGDQPTTETPGATPATPGQPAAGAPDTNPNAPSTTESAPPAAAATGNCVAEDTSFLNGEKIWEYQYILMIAVVFCVFWYFYKRNEWYRWSVVGSTAILLAIYFNVQVDAWVNAWQGTFFDLLQQALSQPGSVDPVTFYGQVFVIFAVLLPNILALVILAFFTSHYVFRWRKAMNSYYMAYWPAIRTTEGAAQRVQEDTMRFASIVEDLGTSFFSSLITLVVFLPILWELSQHITELPILGQVPGSLVWVALISAAFGTVLLAFVGIKLPGLNFQNQRVEAALRKELVYGEDSADRAEPLTSKQLFANVQLNYYRLYFHYTYFNLARYAYLQGAAYIPLLAMSPSILAGTLTLGFYQQISNAFGQVSGSFQFFARAWTTIVELLSVYQRLRLFESFIPQEQEPIKESVSSIATST